MSASPWLLGEHELSTVANRVKGGAGRSADRGPSAGGLRGGLEPLGTLPLGIAPRFSHSITLTTATPDACNQHLIAKLVGPFLVSGTVATTVRTALVTEVPQRRSFD